MSGRTRQQYGRSATTSYSSILQDSGGDILNKCSNLFNKFASRVRAVSQSGDDRIPLHDASNNLASLGSGHSSSSSSSSSSAAASKAAASYQYPMLLKYSKYDDLPSSSSYDSKSLVDSKYKSSKFEPAASQYKPAACASSSLSSSSSYGSGTSSSSASSSSSGYGYSSGYGSGNFRNPLTTSASFSSFSTFKSDYDVPSARSRYGSGVRPSYNRTSSDLGCSDSYGLWGAYASPSTPNTNYDKISSRYKPSRFLKHNHLAATGCDEEDESGDELSVLRKNVSSKKMDYWSQYGSQYGSLSPNIMERCLEGPSSSSYSRLGNLSPQLRRRHGDGGLISASARQRANRPVTVPESKEERESTASIMNRYSGLSTSTLDTETGSTTSSATPDSVKDESNRRKERAQLINMYSLPLNVLHNIGSTHNRKFLKRVKEPASGASGDHGSSSISAIKSGNHGGRRFDQVKEMAAKVTEFCSYIPEEDGSQGPPRKLLYGSASTSDVLSSLGKSGGPTRGSDLSKNSTPDSEKFVLYDPPIVFEKAAVRERPPRTSSYTKPTKPTSLALTRTNTMDLLDSPGDSMKSFGDHYLGSSMLSTPNDMYGLGARTAPTTPTIKVTSYLEPEHEYTFTTFKPTNSSSTTLSNTDTTLSSYKELDKNIAYVPALTPKSPMDLQPLSLSVSVKPKTTTTTTAAVSNSNSKSKAEQDTSYALLKFKSKVVEGLTSSSSKSGGGKGNASSATISGLSSAATGASHKKSGGVGSGGGGGAGVMDLLGLQEVGTKKPHVRPLYSSTLNYSYSSVSSDVGRAGG